jgi:hypothetical protein
MTREGGKKVKRKKSARNKQMWKEKKRGKRTKPI